MIKRTVHGTGYNISTQWDINQVGMAEFAIQSFSWIIPINQELTWPQFASLIESHCDHVKAKIVAETLRTL